MRGLISKRAFDLTFAALGIVCLSPLFLLIAACIKLDSLRFGVFSAGTRREARQNIPDPQVPYHARWR